MAIWLYGGPTIMTLVSIGWLTDMERKSNNGVDRLDNAQLVYLGFVVCRFCSDVDIGWRPRQCI